MSMDCSGSETTTPPESDCNGVDALFIDIECNTVNLIWNIVDRHTSYNYSEYLQLFLYVQ
jgi:hypothetical protein